MGRVVIRNISESSLTGLSGLTGVITEGMLETRAIVADADRPIFVWVHDLAPGSCIRWDDPPVGHLAYLWAGSVSSNGSAVGAGGTAIVEPRGVAMIRAGTSGAKLVHFHQNENCGERSRKAGGQVHLHDAKGRWQTAFEKSGSLGTLFAGSDCATCDLWLHHSRRSGPRPQNTTHYHTADEVIFVLDGCMVVGKRELRAGTAVAIDANTVYSFGVGPEGLAFVNFRFRESLLVNTARGKPSGEPVNELELMRLGDRAYHARQTLRAE